MIKEWFDNGCDYTSGVELYSKLPKCKPNLLKNFLKKQTPQTYEKLKYELKKILQTEGSIVPQFHREPEQVITTSKIPEPKKSVLFHQLPAELRPVLLEAHDYFKRNCLLKVQLNELPDSAERKAIEIQREIDSNWKKNAVCWKKIDHYLEHRVLPKTIQVKNPFSDFTPAALVRRQQQLYSNRSRTEKRLKENRIKIKQTDNRKEFERLNRLILKQENTLIKVNQELTILATMIDGK